MRTRTGIILLAVLLATASALAAEPDSPRFLLAGNDQALWLVRPNEDGKTCNIVRRKLGGNWRNVLHEQNGWPMAAVAEGDRLHLLYAQRQHVLVEADGAEGTSRIAGNLPGDLLAACEATNLPGANGTTLLVFVRRREPPEPAAPTSAAESQPAAGPGLETTEEAHCLYRSAGREWKPLWWRAVPIRPERDARMGTIAAVGETVFRLSAPAAGRGKPALLIREDDHGQNILHTWAPADRPVEIAAFPEQLLVVHRAAPAATSQPRTSPQRYGLALSSWDSDTGNFAAPQPVVHEGKAITFPAEQRLGAARLGEQVALLWNDEGTLRFALSQRDGTVLNVENVSRALHDLPDMDQVSEWYNYFLLGTILIVVGGIFFRKPSGPPRPFSLPASLLPGGLVKRLLAAVLDYLPFYALAVWWFVPRAFLQSGMTYIQNPQDAPPEMLAGILYAMMVSQGLYVSYGTIMELRYGATLGKRLFRLRTVGETGRRPTPREAVLRNVTKIVELSMLVSPSPMRWLMMIFLLLPVLTRYRQRMGDMMARTAVVEAKKTRPAEPTT